MGAPGGKNNERTISDRRRVRRTEPGRRRLSQPAQAAETRMIDPVQAEALDKLDVEFMRHNREHRMAEIQFNLQRQQRNRGRGDGYGYGRGDGRGDSYGRGRGRGDDYGRGYGRRDRYDRY